MKIGTLPSPNTITVLMAGLGLILNGCCNTAFSFENEVTNTVDLRPSFIEKGLSTRAQRARPTCSVFTVVGAMEYALNSSRNAETRLSVEYLNWAANKAVGKPADGAFFSDLWNGFIKHGICIETDMPYEATFNPEIVPPPNAVAHAKELLKTEGLRLYWIKLWDPNKGLNNGQFAEIKRILAKQTPVCGGFLWPKAEKWEDGILQFAPRDQVRDGHSVLLVGYRDDSSQPGGGVFHFLNTSKPNQDCSMTYAYAQAYMNDAVYILKNERIGKASSSFDPYLNPMGPSPAGRNQRVSSNQQPKWHSENLDMTWIKPGESVEMPVLNGPGLINHIWMTSHSGWVGELNSLTIRIYWDQQKEPGIEAPLGDFFAIGQGRPAVVESVPVQVSPAGSMTCYWRMPFRERARIIVTNDNPDRSTGLYWQVDWIELDRLPNDTPYFYARYRQEYPARAGSDYLIADLKGTGRFVGTVMSITMGQDGWFGEGDDFFYVDGEKIPSLQGTGSEDYFNDAWGFRVRSGLWFGQPRWQGDRAGDSGVCYRWHLADPVFFNQSLKFEIEHRGNYDESEDGFFLDRPDFISSVAFWYQTGKPTFFGELPPYPQRNVPWKQHHLVRSFQKAKAAPNSKLQVQTTGFFGARPVLQWSNTRRGEKLSFPFSIDEEGQYVLRLTAASSPDNGSYQIVVDDQELFVHNFRANELIELDLSLGKFNLNKGPHTLTFVDAAAGNQNGPLVVEMLRTLRLPPAAKRTVFTHHEAHFIRLGIGRAVYAYRLAFDRLPDSLETLVSSGIMPNRYLKDENQLPLKARLVNGYFEVESPAENGWKHRWQGLDARR